MSNNKDNKVAKWVYDEENDIYNLIIPDDVLSDFLISIYGSNNFIAQMRITEVNEEDDTYDVVYQSEILNISYETITGELEDIQDSIIDDIKQKISEIIDDFENLNNVLKCSWDE